MAALEVLEADSTPQTVHAAPRLRPATGPDCRRIAELFRLASEGVADYVWSRLAPEHPGLSLLDIGEQRYRRENTAFSWQNCVVAEQGGEVVGMVHRFPIAYDEASDPEAVDPVLRPYAELEMPGSLYISGLAVLPAWQGQGIGTRLLEAARRRGRFLGTPALSLICFAQNTGARRLYERNGFRVIDRRPIVEHPLIHARGEALLMATRS